MILIINNFLLERFVFDIEQIRRDVAGICLIGTSISKQSRYDYQSDLLPIKLLRLP